MRPFQEYLNWSPFVSPLSNQYFYTVTRITDNPQITGLDPMPQFIFLGIKPQSNFQYLSPNLFFSLRPSLSLFRLPLLQFVCHVSTIRFSHTLSTSCLFDLHDVPDVISSTLQCSFLFLFQVLVPLIPRSKILSFDLALPVFESRLFDFFKPWFPHWQYCCFISDRVVVTRLVSTQQILALRINKISSIYLKYIFVILYSLIYVLRLFVPWS